MRIKLYFFITLSILLAACAESSHSPTPQTEPVGAGSSLTGHEEYIDICTAPCIPVYPGAMGAGTKTKAGRGGRVIAVTNLNASGAGSFREALEHNEPRIIIFKVSGTITTNDFLYVRHPYVTIAGQTAPGDGILIRGAGLVITTHDVLVQHLRFRPGNDAPISADDNDAIAILGSQSANDPGAYNVVIDHVSASWSEDEVVSLWFAPHDVTISWSIIAEGLNRSRHPKGTHSAGLLVGSGSNHVSVHHNLIMNNDFRNPLIVGRGTHEFSHNLIYNWGQLPAEINDYSQDTFVNFIGNRYVKGPSSAPVDKDSTEVVFNIDTRILKPLVYFSNNDTPMLNTLLATISRNLDFFSLIRFATPTLFETNNLDSVENSILQTAGALSARRDAVDERLISQFQTNTGAIIDSPADSGGYPVLPTLTSAAADTDNDGMPNTWEAANGLNPNINDSSADDDGDHYTNIEEYLHSL